MLNDQCSPLNQQRPTPVNDPQPPVSCTISFPLGHFSRYRMIYPGGCGSWSFVCHVNVVRQVSRQYFIERQSYELRKNGSIMSHDTHIWLEQSVFSHVPVQFTTAENREDISHNDVELWFRKLWQAFCTHIRRMHHLRSPSLRYPSWSWVSYMPRMGGEQNGNIIP